MLAAWGNHSAFIAFEPVNEPWSNTNINVLMDFYRDVRALVQTYAPQAYFVFHDSFIYNADLWNKMFRDDDHDKVVMDHHYYQAWNTGMNTTQ